MKLGIAGVGLLGLTGTAAWVCRDQISKLQPGEIVDYLKSHYDYLTLNIGDDKLHEFANQYRDHYYQVPRESWYLFRRGDEETFRRFIDHLSVTFLMSTDFFLTGADESKPVNYVTFYHPYRSPCWNPLSAG